MKSALMGTAVLTCLLVSTSPIWAHPGHHHLKEVPAWKKSDPTPFLKEAGPTSQFLFALATAFFVATVLLRGILPCKNTNLHIILTPPGLALAVLMAALGCGENGGEDHSAISQPKHDRKLLEEIFNHFKVEGVKFRADDQHFYIESNAFPNHPLMVGITAWQQQVPLPQPYTGENSWKLPIRPVFAVKPLSTKAALYRGAIAVAVNGVPIFNPLNNRGEDAFLAGELDEFGGHCGRGDDYHYHIAPVHLEKVVGKGKPIAFTLDGFPIFGYTSADGKEPTDLDEFNGRFEKDGSYRFYATRKYPYVNGAMRGVINIRGGQIEPQPRDAPVRPPGEPLRGAKVTRFNRNDEKKTYTLTYDLGGATNTVSYTIAGDGSVNFVFTDGRGNERTETYRQRPRK